MADILDEILMSDIPPDQAKIADSAPLTSLPLPNLPIASLPLPLQVLSQLGDSPRGVDEAPFNASFPPEFTDPVPTSAHPISTLPISAHRPVPVSITPLQQQHYNPLIHPQTTQQHPPKWPSNNLLPHATDTSPLPLSPGQKRALSQIALSSTPQSPPMKRTKTHSSQLNPSVAPTATDSNSNTTRPSRLTTPSSATQSTTAPPCKPKPVVMPPSAKSILERREKAIREGRRKDAKLSESERRILRRLRNRESAERCRLRRVQQAAALERKIQDMQVENERLVAIAEQYQKTICRLQSVIDQYTAQRTREGGGR